MHYFGVPTCPYCKKRVNIIRTWSLKRQGEYKCPRCGGISNIFLSPLIHVFAVLAIFSGGALYFFHKFILDDITLKTVVQIIVPFAAFYLISLFMVYLVKPVIKKVPRAEADRKKRSAHRVSDNAGRKINPPGQMLYDNDEYLPERSYRAGQGGQNDYNDSDMKVVPELLQRKPAPRVPQDTAKVQTPQNRTAAPRTEVPTATPAAPVQNQVKAATVAVPNKPVQQPAAPVRQIPRPEPVKAPAEVRRAPAATNTAPTSNDDFFAKYDDPDYVERRLREIKQQRGE